MSANSLSELRKSRGNFDTLLEASREDVNHHYKNPMIPAKRKLSVDKRKWFLRNSFPSPFQG